MGKQNLKKNPEKGFFNFLKSEKNFRLGHVQDVCTSIKLMSYNFLNKRAHTTVRTVEHCSNTAPRAFDSATAADYEAVLLEWHYYAMCYGHSMQQKRALVNNDKFLTAFGHRNNATYILITSSNGSKPWLAVWSGHGSDVRVIPNLDQQLAQLVSMDFLPGIGLAATNDIHVLIINPDNGSFQTAVPLSDRGLENGGQTTTDGSNLYVYLTDSEHSFYYIATVHISATHASVSLSVPSSSKSMFWLECIGATNTIVLSPCALHMTAARSPLSYHASRQPEFSRCDKV
jgi:hypothetical protein